MSIRRGTPRTTRQDHTTYTAVMAATFLQGVRAFCQPGLSPVLWLPHTSGTSRNKRSRHLPLQTTTCQARGACCKPILTQIPRYLQATDHARRDAAGRTATLDTRCPLSHRGGSHESRPRSPSPQPSAKPRAGCQPHHTCKDNFVFTTCQDNFTPPATAEGSSLEELELNKLDLITELQSFAVCVCGYVYAFL